MDEYKLTKVPMEPWLVLEKNIYKSKLYQASVAKIKRYLLFLGCLFWLTYMTQLNISYLVRKCSCYSSNPAFLYNIALKRIVRYLKGTKKLRLQYGFLRNHKDRGLIELTDFFHCHCLDTCRSTYGYLFFLYNRLVSWASQCQATVANSTDETQYLDECNTAKISVFLTNNLKKLGYERPNLNTILFMADNQSAIKLTFNFVNHLWVKHIDILFHKVCKLILNNLL